MTGVDVVALFANAASGSAVLRIATPLIFGTLGVLLCERAGVLNLGIEGHHGRRRVRRLARRLPGRQPVDRRASRPRWPARRSACCTRC